MTLHTDPRPLPPNAEKVFQGIFFSVWQWQQELYDGSTATFEAVSRRDYAYALGILPDQKILLLNDEQPDRPPVLTPAGGGVEAGEDPAEAAQRELREETGYAAGSITLWHRYQPGNKIFMTCHAYIARNLTKAGEPALEAGERVTLQTYSFDEFLALGHDPRLRDWMIRIKLLEALADPVKKKDLYKVLYD